jgi:hypothetical protein
MQYKCFDENGEFIPKHLRSVPEEEKQPIDSQIESPLVLRGKASTEVLSTKSKASKDITSLIPNWERKRLKYRIRLKTLAKIFLSRWFYFGLKYFERELLLISLQRLNLEYPILEEVVIAPVFETRNVTDQYTSTKNQVEKPVRAINVIGKSIFADLQEQDELDSLNRKGFKLYDLSNLLDFIYSEEQLKAVWKLTSFQSLYDSIFQPLSYEQTGKLNIKKPRQRGYTDGRGSTRDPKRTQLAYRADQIFWENKFEDKWEEFFHEIEKFALT